ncbi:MAG: hypothetical protein K2P81_00185 [Bacteriovoracaceae bacterium]|nr:hypothetical protein [Bacteriovoracaceae bacterium]
MKWFVFLFLFSCTHALTGKHPAFVEHFTGEVLVYKPKATKPMGKILSIVRRTVDPDAKQIMEEVVQPTKEIGKAKEITTNFTQIDENGKFKVQDHGKTFMGFVQFQGTPWSWEEWTYDIQLKNGSYIKGFGQFESDEMRTEKRMYSKKGKLLYILKERFREVDAATYKIKRKELLNK